MKRNDIVLCGIPDSWNFFGRVHRQFDDNHYIVACCGSHYMVYHKDHLILKPDYHGYKRATGSFCKMTSLRKLLIQCKKYNPDLVPDLYQPRGD